MVYKIATDLFVIWLCAATLYTQCVVDSFSKINCSKICRHNIYYTIHSLCMRTTMMGCGTRQLVWLGDDWVAARGSDPFLFTTRTCRVCVCVSKSVYARRRWWRRGVRIFWQNTAGRMPRLVKRIGTNPSKGTRRSCGKCVWWRCGFAICL